MQNQLQTGSINAAQGSQHRKQLGLVSLSDEAEAVGVVELHPASDAEQMAFHFLRNFEQAVEAIGRKDIDLLQVGVCESQSTFAKFIPLRPAQGWKPGALRLRSLAACAKPGVGHLLFVLIATPGQGMISYELKMGYRLNPLFFWPMTPLAILWQLVGGFLHEPDFNTRGGGERQPFTGLFAAIEQSTLPRAAAYLPLMTGALAKAIESVEATLPGGADLA